MTKQKLEQEVAEPGKVYDCRIKSQYGHVTSTKGVYLGKVMGARKQLHGFVYLEEKQAEFVTLIKFSKISVNKSILEIENPIRVYNLDNNEEREYRSLLEEKVK